MLPVLTVNRSFMQAFIEAETPCCALGLVEEGGEPCGLLALRPDEEIPYDVLDMGFNFGHSLLGTSTYEVIHFAFEFYGFKTYNLLLNPNNLVVQAVVEQMIEGGDYFFFALSEQGRVTSFRAEIGREYLEGLKDNLPRIRNSTTHDEYHRDLTAFAENPDPPGTLLHWVCQDDTAFLDLSTDRLDLNPAS